MSEAEQLKGESAAGREVDLGRKAGVRSRWMPPEYMAGEADLRAREVGVMQPTTFLRSCAGSEGMVRRLRREGLLEGHDGCVNTVCFSPGGDLLLSGSDDRDIIVWDWERGVARLRYDSGHVNNVFQARSMPESGDRTIVSCAADGQVRCGLLRDSGVVETKRLGKHRGRAHKLAVDLTMPHCFFSCGEDAVVRHFDLREDRPNSVLFTCLRAPSYKASRLGSADRAKVGLNVVAVNPVRPHLFAIAGADEFARVYDVRKVSPSHGGLVCEGPDTPVDMFAPRHLMNRVRGGQVHITCVAFSYQGELLVSYNDELIYLFNDKQGHGPTPESYPAAGRMGQRSTGRGRARENSCIGGRGEPSTRGRVESEAGAEGTPQAAASGQREGTGTYRWDLRRARAGSEGAVDSLHSVVVVSGDGSAVRPLPSVRGEEDGIPGGDRGGSEGADGGDAQGTREGGAGKTQEEVEEGRLPIRGGAREGGGRSESSGQGQDGMDSAGGSDQGGGGRGGTEGMGGSPDVREEEGRRSGAGNGGEAEESEGEEEEEDKEEEGVELGAEVPGGYVQVYRGHRNSQTVKGVAFFGLRTEHVVSGSDCGHIFIWSKRGGKLLMMLPGDTSVVNCLEPHPAMTVLATSGIESNVKIWMPTREEAAGLPRDAEETMRRNERRMQERSRTITLSPEAIMRLLRLQGWRHSAESAPGRRRTRSASRAREGAGSEEQGGAAAAASGGDSTRSRSERESGGRQGLEAEADEEEEEEDEAEEEGEEFEFIQGSDDDQDGTPQCRIA